MNLKDILTISGKSGLYKLVANNKNGFIVECLKDKKRSPAFMRDRISALDEISIFTNEDEVSLKEVFVKLYKYMEHKPVDIDVISKPEELKKLFTAFFPEYDEDRFYTSHMKKVVQWYNELLANNMLDENLDNAEDTNSESVPEDKSVEDKSNE
jgi:hypothetical protein